MNYIKQINGFWNWVQLNSISQGEMILYMAILHCANISNWRSSLTIPNSTLQSLTKILDRSQFNKTRNRLIQTGLIRYENGSKGKAGTYIIKDFCGNIDTDSDTDRNMCGNIATNSTTNKDTIQYTNSYTNKDTNCTPYINKTKTKQNETISTPQTPQIDYRQIVDSFNEICVDLPKVRDLTDKRRSLIKARLKKHTPERMREIFEAVHKSDFLCGRIKRNNDDKPVWKASFDWLMNENNLTKVVEGTYDNQYAGERSFEVYHSDTDHEAIERIIMEKY